MKRSTLKLLSLLLAFIFMISIVGCDKTPSGENVTDIYSEQNTQASTDEIVESGDGVEDSTEAPNETEDPTEPEEPTDPEEPIVPEEPTDPEEPTEPEAPVEPEPVISKSINWKSLYDSGLMRAQWWNDIGSAQNNYTSLFNVTATENSITSTPKSNGDNRAYYSTEMYTIDSATLYEYTFEAKNNRATGYAGVIFAYDTTGVLPYFAYGEFDNNSDKGSCVHIRYRKGHFDAENYSCVVNNDDLTAIVKQTDDGYGQFKVIYEGYNVKFCYLNSDGQYVQLGSTITLPTGSKICFGVFSREGNTAAMRTVSLRNCVLTPKNDAAIEYLGGDKVLPSKSFDLKIGSYNIFHAEKAGYDYSKIANTIKNSGLDIIGLQEVDHFTKRNGWTNQTSEIAAKLGYKHRVFFKAISHDGGEYGLAIISKYPILKHELIKLSSGSAEQRILAHAEIDVNGTVIHFFVTHLSYDGEGGGASRTKQFKEIANKLGNYNNFILTGDFNTRNLDEYNVIKNAALVNSKTNSVITYPDGRSPLDNIVYSTAHFTASGPNVVTNSYSDHYMIWSTLTYKEVAG